jgi:hypothetical protein
MKTLWQKFLEHEFAYILTIFVITVIIGTIFYYHVEEWRVIDAMYFCVTVLTTVGFGDFSPQTDAGKIFAMIYQVIGTGIMVGLIDVVAHLTHNTSKKIEKREERKEES